MITIGIVGFGYVGKAMFNLFIKKYKTIFYDPYVDGSCTKEDINKCDMAVICVFTPSSPDGQCDISIVDETVSWINTLILIKSTIAPGTTDFLIKKYNKHIVFSPEYIGESDYDTGRHNFNLDASLINFVTLGGDTQSVKKCADILIPILGPNKKYNQVSAITAELAKYMENCYLATKVVFCYEFDNICKSFGADYNAVRESWLLDPRIESSHTGVFKTNIYPFSGKCLPKDLLAMITASKEMGYDPLFLKEVEKSNFRIGEQRNA